MKNKFIILGILFLSLLSFYSITQVYAIYNSKVDAEVDEIQFAKFVFNTKQTDEINLRMNNFLPGDQREYKFEVSNNTEVVQTDVSVKYKIYLESFKVLPLDFYLILDDGEEEENILLSCNDKFTFTSEGKYSCVTDELILSYDDVEYKKYVLRIVFPLNNNDSAWNIEYSGMIDYINLKIKSWQKTD